jgi:hypothetical protein
MTIGDAAQMANPKRAAKVRVRKCPMEPLRYKCRSDLEKLATIRRYHKWGVSFSVTYYGTKRNPGMAIEPNQKQLLDGLIIRGSCFDADAGMEHTQLDVEIGGLLHHIRAREIVTAFL